MEQQLLMVELLAVAVEELAKIFLMDWALEFMLQQRKLLEQKEEKCLLIELLLAQIQIGIQNIVNIAKIVKDA